MVICSHTCDAIACADDGSGGYDREEETANPSHHQAGTGRYGYDAAEEEEAASPWVEKFSAQHGRAYWVNVNTGKSSWVDPVASGKPPGGGSGGVALPSGGGAAGVTGGAAGGGGGMPPGWTEHWSDEHNRNYYQNSTSGERSWTRPVSESVTAAAPARTHATGGGASDWDKRWSDQHKRHFWVNKTTGESSWTDPAATGPTPSVRSQQARPTQQAPPHGQGGGGVASSSLPQGWAEREHQGRAYFVNTTTGEKSWTRPEQ